MPAVLSTARCRSTTSIARFNELGNFYALLRCHKRHVLLRFYYLGWDYQGFAAQENSAQTIEHHLFSALQKTCLIESRETSNYHRCGRTDKGVSAFSQVRRPRQRHMPTM